MRRTTPPESLGFHALFGAFFAVPPSFGHTHSRSLPEFDAADSHAMRADRPGMRVARLTAMRSCNLARRGATEAGARARNLAVDANQHICDGSEALLLVGGGLAPAKAGGQAGRVSGARTRGGAASFGSAGAPSK